MTTGRSGASFFVLGFGFALVSAFGCVSAFDSAGAFLAAGFFAGAFLAAGCLAVEALEAPSSAVLEVASAAPLPRVAVSFFGFAAGLCPRAAAGARR